MTEKVAEAIDREAWNLVANHKADLPKDVSISWVSLGEGLTSPLPFPWTKRL